MPAAHVISAVFIERATQTVRQMFAVGASLAARFQRYQSRRERRSYMLFNNRSANPDARQVRFFTALSSTDGLPNSSKVKRSRARVTAV